MDSYRFAAANIERTVLVPFGSNVPSLLGPIKAPLHFEEL